MLDKIINIFILLNMDLLKFKTYMLDGMCNFVHHLPIKAIDIASHAHYLSQASKKFCEESGLHGGFCENHENHENHEKIKELQENGVITIDNLVDKQELKKFTQDLNDLPTFAGHVLNRYREDNHKGLKLSQRLMRDDWSQICMHQQDILNQEFVIKLLTNNNLMEILYQFMGCLPVFYQANIMYNNHSSSINDLMIRRGNEWHRDYENIRPLVVFIYLTDIYELSQGPQRYLRKSHLEDKDINFGNYDAEIIDKNWNKANETTIYGQAGTTIINTPFGMHYGVPPSIGHRGILWLRFGMFGNMVKNDTGEAKINPDILNKFAPSLKNKFVLQEYI